MTVDALADSGFDVGRSLEGGSTLGEATPFAAAPRGHRDRRSACYGGLALLILIAIAAASLHLALEERRAALHGMLSQRLEALAAGRADVLAAWLETSASVGERLTGSELVRLFTHEMALSRDDPGLAAALREQLPYMVQLMDEFARESRLVGVYLIGPDGIALARSREAPALTGLAHERALAFLGSHKERGIGPFEALDGAPTIDIMLPVMAPHAIGRTGDGRAGVLMLTVDAGPRLLQILEPSGFHIAGESMRLIARIDGGAGEFRSQDGQLIVERRTIDGGAEPGAAFAYELRPVGTGGEVLSVGASVPGLDATFVQEIDADTALAPIRVFATTAGMMALLGTLALSGGFIAFWSRKSSQHNAELARQYASFAAHMRRQHQLLESITGTARELIGLKDRNGCYRYVNPALAAVLGRSPESLQGLLDDDLFGAPLARRLARSDREAIRNGIAMREAEPIEIGGRTRYLDISKVPLPAEPGQPAGIVMVARDSTELVEERRRRERLMNQTVDALVQALELRDPFLVGHSARLTRCAGAVARRLDLPPQDVATIELAARLSQIGKIFVPRSILAKTERLNAREQRVVREHVRHASALLDRIDFDLPVGSAIEQMHERLDGSGYPAGLKGDAIGLVGRILGAANVFCARIAPRSYRDRIEPAEAIAIMSEHPEIYDVSVVEALAWIEAGGADGEGSGIGTSWPPATAACQLEEPAIEV